MTDLVSDLRAFAQACRGSMWQSRDETISLMDRSADEIERRGDIIDEIGSTLNSALEHLPEPLKSIAAEAVEKAVTETS